jgi:CDP-4-dehydro-6-deoxyglucose reductase/ferredoxin-NAD(P)+ reductase (naphthalene dioxygenase ferredoxin-specific)
MTSHKVSIAQFNMTIEVRKGFSILDAALKAGLDYPYACRRGNCSSCKTLLIKGEVEHKPYDKEALPDEERANKIILACRAMPQTDCEVEFLEEDEMTFSPSKTECEISQIERVTHDVAVVKARACNKGIVAFTAGQFGTIGFAGLPPREYSFANRPGTQELEFHVRSRAEGRVSRHIYDKAQPGDKFVLNAPFGNAYLRKEHPGPITLVVGGTGLAPAKSIALDALATLPGRSVSLFFSVREQRDVYLSEQFISLAEKYPNFTFVPVVTRPNGEHEERASSVFSLIAERFPSLAGHKIYTCGSPGLVAACQKFGSEMGVVSKDCHADPFVVAVDEPLPA